MGRIVLVIGLALLLGFVVFSSAKQDVIPANDELEEIHYHAGFQVYKDNVLQDYSGLEYMHLAPCSEEEHDEEPTPEHEQEEKAHLHDNVGDVVHVHREGAVWGDLFRNIKVEIGPSEVYVNGNKLEEKFLSYPIAEYGSVVVFEGENTDIEDKLQDAVTKEHIIEAEGRSESCGN